MFRSRIPALIAIAALVPLFALAIWFRVSSLAMTAPNGDEAFFAVQVARLFQGEGMASRTPSGNPVNLLVIGSEIPLYSLLGPSSYVIKIPAAIAGLLAVIGAYFLWKRALDGTTAVIGATLLAVLPVALAECRIGAEAAWNPLVGVILCASVFRGHRLGTLLAFLLCYHVHPTYLFLLPLIVLILAVKLLGRTEGDSKARWRVLITTAVGALAVLGPIVLAMRGRSVLHWTYQTYEFGPGNWPRYFLYYERLLMGFCEVGPTDTTPGFDLAFWAVFGTILGVGSWCLWRQRRWDRLALVAGLLISLGGMHLVTGPDILRPYFVRYGLFLVAPSVLTVACCVRAMLVKPEGGWSTVGHRLQVSGMIGLAWIVLLGFKAHYLDHLLGLMEGQESLWTLRTEVVNPKEWAVELMLQDLDEARNAGLKLPEETAVLADDWWTYRPLQFYFSEHPTIRTGSLEAVEGPQRDALIETQLRNGGYIVGTKGGDVINGVEARFAPESLTHWHLFVPPQACLAIYRLKRENEPLETQPVIVLRPDPIDAPTRTR